MRTLGIIPARFASTRLPGKPLADIAGKSMVARVLERAAKAGSLSEVVVATDDPRITEHVSSIGGRAVMTDPSHPSGTDRCYEALCIVGREQFDAVVNIQGDEPFLVPDQIEELCAALLSSHGGIATLGHRVSDEADLDDPGRVKITTTVHGDALYFSRAAIPYLRDPAGGTRTERFPYLRHVGLYAYRVEVLQRLVALRPSPLERAEALEQLRWLEHGFQVRVGLTEHPTFCVDTPEDLERARRMAGQH